MTEEIKEIQQYLDRIKPLQEADEKIREEWGKCRLKAKALYIKRKVIRPAFKSQGTWKEFKKEWNETIKEHGHTKLPPQRCLFSEPDLFDDLDTLMDDYMDELGMAGYKEQEQDLNADFYK